MYVRILFTIIRYVDSQQQQGEEENYTAISIDGLRYRYDRLIPSTAERRVCGMKRIVSRHDPSIIIYYRIQKVVVVGLELIPPMRTVDNAAFTKIVLRVGKLLHPEKDI